MPDRITYVGHGTVLLELGGARLLTDPVLRRRLLHLRRHPPTPDPAVGERIDAVLISHLHPDHLDPPTLRRIERRGPVIVPRPGGATLRRRRFDGVSELEAGESADLAGVRVTATRAVHDGRRYKLGRRIPALGYLIEAPGGPRVYFAGDTDVFGEMSELAGVDVALLPVTGWGTKVGWGHLDPERAARATAVIRPRIVVPIHWGTFVTKTMIRRHPGALTDPPRQLAGLLAERAPDVRVELLEPGESLEL